MACHLSSASVQRLDDRGKQFVAALALQVDALAAADAGGRVSLTHGLEEDVGRYARFLWDHMGRE